ncbi:MAG: UPF0175 family protein [Cyclobacteriaceae bacterium]
MVFTISDSLLAQAHMSEEEFKVQLALFLYQKEVFTLGQASELADVDQIAFQRLLSEHKINIHYDVEDFEADLRNLGL